MISDFISDIVSVHVPDTACTCEVGQAQLLQAVLPIHLVVDHDGQRVLVLVQRGASDDPQVVQWQSAELVESYQDVARHLPDGLREKEKKRKSAYIQLLWLRTFLLG